MAADNAGSSISTERRKTVHSRQRSGASTSLIILSAAVLAVLNPVLATASDLSIDSEDEHGLSIAKDDTPIQFPHFMDSFNGLRLIDHEDDTEEVPGLDIVTRAPGSGKAIGNNQFERGEISMGGELQQYSFSPASAGSNASAIQSSNMKRENTTVYLSLNICTGPILEQSISSTAQQMPQLAVYVTTSNPQTLGPGNDDSGQTVYNTSQGYMSATVTTESEVYIGIAAPERGDFTGSYSYQIAASTDNFFHNVDDQATILELNGSGLETALLSTGSSAGKNLTEEQRTQWESKKTVYSLFVNNAINTAASGLSQSYCALEHLSQSENKRNVQASMAHRKLDSKPQEQFYITGLNRSSTYVGVLAMGNSTDSKNGVVGGGGKLWKARNFTTKSGNYSIVQSSNAIADRCRWQLRRYL